MPDFSLCGAVDFWVDFFFVCFFFVCFFLVVAFLGAEALSCGAGAVALVSDEGLEGVAGVPCAQTPETASAVNRVRSFLLMGGFLWNGPLKRSDLLHERTPSPAA